MKSLKELYPNQTYVRCSLIIRSSDVTTLCSIVSDHGFILRKYVKPNINDLKHTFKVCALIPVSDDHPENKPLEGDWSETWEHITILNSNTEIIDRVMNIHHIVDNGKNCFITTNRNNQRPRRARCE